MNLGYCVLLCTLPSMLFAAGGSGEYDILPRAVNFAIFVAIIYYLIAEPLKGLYFKRLHGIAEKLDSIQLKLKESKAKKEEAILKVEEAKASAKSIAQVAKKEVEALKKRFEKELLLELENMDKTHNEQIEIERRRMTRQVVSEVLDEIFDEDSITIDESKFVSIVLKKVA
ncbi:MAG: F0F1 ATP synthase subunit B [Campylobacteraceae bacterium]|nr:F0F1 ATP synthase subunit B [Campylobacteraceae bacterium]